MLPAILDFMMLDKYWDRLTIKIRKDARQRFLGTLWKLGLSNRKIINPFKVRRR